MHVQKLAHKRCSCGTRKPSELCVVFYCFFCFNPFHPQESLQSVNRSSFQTPVKLPDSSNLYRRCDTNPVDWLPDRCSCHSKVNAATCRKFSPIFFFFFCWRFTRCGHTRHAHVCFRVRWICVAVFNCEHSFQVCVWRSTHINRFIREDITFCGIT